MRGGMLVVAFGTALLSGCGAQFQEVAPPGAGFTVQMPGTPKEQSQAAAGTMMKIHSVESRNGAYMLTHADLPIPANESPAQVQTRLDGSRDGAIGNMQGRLTGEEKITLGKYPGRDVRFDIPAEKGSGRARIYLVGSKLIMVMAIGERNFAGSADAAKFIESVQLTGGK